MELEHEQIPVSVSLVHPGRIDTPYNEHAGSYMPMQPVHKGMAYAVGSQAKAAACSGPSPPG